MKPTRTWVLIADGAHGRVLEQVGRGHALSEVPGMKRVAELPRSHDLGDDRPGRTEQSVGTARSAMEPRSDPHRELKRQMARELAELMATKLAERAYDRLIVVAPPVTLGDLREALPEPVRKVVAHEVASDLTRTPDHEIARHLGDALP